MFLQTLLLSRFGLHTWLLPRSALLSCWQNTCSSDDWCNHGSWHKESRVQSGVILLQQTKILLSPTLAAFKTYRWYRPCIYLVSYQYQICQYRTPILRTAAHFVCVGVTKRRRLWWPKSLKPVRTSIIIASCRTTKGPLSEEPVYAAAPDLLWPLPFSNQ